MTALLTNSDADPRDWTPASGEECLVYHAEMLLQGQRIMLSDERRGHLPAENPLSLAITFNTAEQVRRASELLLEGGQVIHPLQRTTYSSCFISLRDKFGMRWELMTEQTER